MTLVLRTIQDIPVDGIPRNAVVLVDKEGMGKPIAWFFEETGELSAEEYMDWRGHREIKSRQV